MNGILQKILGPLADIRCYIESELNNCRVDDKTIKIFQEIFKVHGNGYYRNVCFTLFLEIERVLRNQFSGGNVNIPFNKILENFINTSDNILGLTKNQFSWLIIVELFKLFCGEEEYKKWIELNEDLIQNRESALNKLAEYDTEKDSINMILISYYIFRISTILLCKKEKRL